MWFSAKERAGLSARRLTTKHGALLRRWAGARRKAWSVRDNWTVADVSALLAERMRTDTWEPLTAVMGDVAKIDEAICRFCDIYPSLANRSEFFPAKNAYLQVGRALAMTIDQIHDAMRKDAPTITREKVRKYVHKANREGELHRLKRGLYVVQMSIWRRRHWAGADEEESKRWELRIEKWRFLAALVLLSHYLLSGRASYRKAREMGISNRTYYYWLSAALGDLDEDLEDCS